MAAAIEDAVRTNVPSARVVAVDVNGDGRPDVIFSSRGARTMLFVNNGGRHFLAPVQLSSFDVLDLATGDFNKDGHPDLAMVAGDSTCIALNSGSGSFSDPFCIPLQPPLRLRSLAVGDFDGDGNLDIVASGDDADTTEPSVAIYLGTGTGGFQAPRVVRARIGTPVVADLNGDGLADIAGFYETEMTIIPGSHSAFTTSASYNVSFGPGRPVTGDFNNDGGVDIAGLTDQTRVAGLLNICRSAPIIGGALACAGRSSYYTALGFSALSWSIESGPISTAPFLSTALLPVGIHTLTLTAEQDGCVLKTSKSISVLPEPCLTRHRAVRH